MSLDITLPSASAQPNITQPRVLGSLDELIDLPIDIASPRFFVRDDPNNQLPIIALFGQSAVQSLDQLSLDGFNKTKTDEQLEYLLELTPKDWKQQDHYRVLGLQHLRYKASFDEIKVAHRYAVLNYHPDKLASKPELKRYNIEDAYKCIAKAFEVLSDPIKRLQFDSVDTGISDDIPTDDKFCTWWNASPDHKEYFSNVDELFIRESRFSKKSNTPKFGNINSSKREVDSFYNFWYNFDSTRTFEYLDSEDAELADNRYNKRHAEQKNKSERIRRKNEDNARVRTLVDRVLKLDERMKRFKEEEKMAKKNKGKARINPSTTEQQANLKLSEEEELAKKKTLEEEAEKAKAIVEAQAKASAKENKEIIKKAKKAIKNLIIKEFTYLSDHPTAAQMEQVLIDLEVLLEAYKDDADQLTKVLKLLQNAGTKGRAAVCEAFSAQLKVFRG